MDENVVHVDRNVSFIDEISENEVHHRLEGGRGVREAEKHNHGLEKAAVCLESRLPLIPIANAYVIVPPSDVQFCEERQPAAVHPRESVHQFSYQW